MSNANIEACRSVTRPGHAPSRRQHSCYLCAVVGCLLRVQNCTEQLVVLGLGVGIRGGLCAAASVSRSFCKQKLRVVQAGVALNPVASYSRLQDKLLGKLLQHTIMCLAQYVNYYVFRKRINCYRVIHMHK